ncbi:MAG: hypothetical protein WC659_06015 [Patescibacteria group bacterium]
MVVQFHDGRYHSALNMGPGKDGSGDLYLLPFEEGEVYVVFTEHGGRVTSKTSHIEVPCSLEGKRLPVLWGGTVGSRKGLQVFQITAHRGVTSGYSTYILERVSTRIVRVARPESGKSISPEAEAWAHKFLNARHKRAIFVFDPDHQQWKREREPQGGLFGGDPRDDEKPYRDGEIRTATHRIDIEPGKSSELDNVHGQDRLIELFRKARIPMMQYEGCISDKFEILSTNLDGWRNFNGMNWFTWKGFGSCVLINFYGAPVAFVSIHQHDRHSNPDWMNEMGNLLEHIEEIRKAQRAKENAVHQKGLDTHPVSYVLENHDGMVVCMATMHDGSKRVATIRKIEQDWRTHELKIELGNFYHSFRVSPLEYSWVADLGLKEFFASQTDIEKEAIRVAALRKKYWAERAGKVFAQYELKSTQKGSLPELEVVAYFVEPDDELGGRPVRCRITDHNASLRSVQGTFLEVMTPDGKKQYTSKPRQ